ncbi:L-histidine N(alpha)-methyltransferase [Chloroflexota bacterium]
MKVDSELHNLKPEQEFFLAEVLNGLSKTQKELPCKYLYDEQGSILFERICHLDEYYIPRVETGIIKASVAEINELLGVNINLIEYGSGNSIKTRILLDHLHGVAAYMPIDICQEQLLSSKEELNIRYPHLKIHPVCADYTGSLELPAFNPRSGHNVVFFPGSSIGNFDPYSAKHFLEHVAIVCGPSGGLLIGVDLKKDPDVLHRAYNDSQGITAAFNLNILKRVNRELNSNFQPEYFSHYAYYNPSEGRIEMHLVSLRDQTVNLNNDSFNFSRFESIWTESSYKFTLDEFQQIAADAGFKLVKTWTDEKQWFSIQYLVSIQ